MRLRNRLKITGVENASGELPFSTLDLFANGELGAWFRGDESVTFSDSDGEIQVTDGGAIARVNSPVNGNTLTRTTEAERPIFNADTKARIYSSSRYMNSSVRCGSVANTLAVHCTWQNSKAGTVVPVGHSSFFLARRTTTGFLAAAVGNLTSAQQISSFDVSGQTGVAVLVADGTTVKIYWNGEEVFSGSQSGSPSTSLDVYEGTFNSNNTPATSNFFNGRVYNSLLIQRALTAQEITDLTNSWLNTKETLPFVFTDYGFTYSGIDQHRNGGLAADGRSFMLKRSASTFTIVAEDGESAIRDDLGLPTEFNTSGLVLGVNGKLYSPPRDSEFACVVDPSTDTATLENFGLTISTSQNKWTDGVLGNDGKIYCIPSMATDILIIDTNPSVATATRSTLGATFAPPGSGGGDMQWIDGVKANDGRIFCVPYSASSVLIIDPATNSASLNNFELTFGGSNAQNWSRGALGIDGKIYCAPRNASSILVIDPATNTAELKTYGLDLSEPDKYSSAYTLSDGKIYMPPSLETTMLVIDVVRQIAFRMPLPGIAQLTRSNYFIGGVVGTDGKLRCPPRSTNKFIVIG
jgi:hypothetical protein